MKKYYKLSVVLSLFSFYIIQAQNVITGMVTSETNQEILFGVSVLAKEESSGTYTDVYGKFSIEVSDKNAILVFSYVGYETQSIPLNSRETLQIIMKPVVKEFGEVVVTGFRDQKKRNVSSAVVNVSAETINTRIANSPSQLLQGRLPGLQVIQNSAEPGNPGVNFRIRGVGTFSGAGNNPLIIVDGTPGSLSSLNPNDIALITVLKDAASAALYGARGANGVVVITTKTGQGQTGFSINYNGNVSMQQANSLPDVVTNSAEYMELYNEASVNAGNVPIYSQSDIDLYKNPNRDKTKYPDYNWFDDIFKTAVVQNHYINMTGSKDKTSYSVGLGLSDVPGLFKGFTYKKYTLQTNLSTQINDHIKFTTSTSLRHDNRVTPGFGASDQFLSTLAAKPMFGPTLPDGRYASQTLDGKTGFKLGNKNPFAFANTTFNISKGYYIQTRGMLSIEFLKNLFWENKVGINYSSNYSNFFKPNILFYDYSTGKFASENSERKGLDNSRSESIQTSFYSQLHYNRSFGDEGTSINILLGRQEDTSEGGSLSGSRLEYPTNLLRELNAGPSKGQTNGGSSSKWALVGYYGNANYIYKDKYILSASMRYDGTSRLPKDSRWGLFYAGSLGYRLSKEAFMQNIDWLNDLKIRGSYGVLGNQNIGNYPYQSVLNQTSYSFASGQAIGFKPGGLVTPDLTWESTSTLDFGLDATVLDNKLSFLFDWYLKRTTDILRTLQVPAATGLGAPVVNSGIMENLGFEVQATYRDRIGQDFEYSIVANVDGYKNKLVNYGSTEKDTRTIKEEGLEYNAFRLWQVQGVFQSDEEIVNAANQSGIGPTPKPGDIRIRDVNGDKKIDDEDRVVTNGRNPSVNYSLNLGIKYKNFDATVFFYGSHGRKIYVSGWGAEPFVQTSSPTTDWRNRWTPENPSSTTPRIYLADVSNAVGYPSTHFLKNASFFRIKNINIGYTFDNLLKKMKSPISNLRLYATAENLLTFSDYPGLDPERVNDGRYVAYPQARTYTFGISLSF